MDVKVNDPFRHETMRINGQAVDAEGRIDVLNPYTGAVTATVPKGQVRHVQDAFQAAADYKPTLSRARRAEILRAAAAILDSGKDEISDLITAESGLSKKDTLYEVGRACDVFNLAAQLCILDDGEVYSCDITPKGPRRKISACANRSASSPRLRRLTIRSTRSPTRSRRRSPPTTAWF